MTTIQNIINTAKSFGTAATTFAASRPEIALVASTALTLGGTLRLGLRDELTARRLDKASVGMDEDTAEYLGAMAYGLRSTDRKDVAEGLEGAAERLKELIANAEPIDENDFYAPVFEANKAEALLKAMEPQSQKLAIAATVGGGILMALSLAALAHKAGLIKTPSFAKKPSVVDGAPKPLPKPVVTPKPPVRRKNGPWRRH